MNAFNFVVKQTRYQWYFELQASNGKVIYTSHKFTSKQNALNGIKVLINTVKSNPPIIYE